MKRWAPFDIVAGSLLLVVASFGPLSGYLFSRVATRDAIHRIQVAQCLSGNLFRENDKARWEYVLRLSKTRPAQNATQARQLVAFESYITAADKLRDCSKL